MKDVYGREYASDLKFGDTVQVDDGFTCMKPWKIIKVLQDDVGDLYVDCHEGEHYLDKVDGFYIGIYNDLY